MVTVVAWRSSLIQMPSSRQAPYIRDYGEHECKMLFTTRNKANAQYFFLCICFLSHWKVLHVSIHKGSFNKEIQHKTKLAISAHIWHVGKRPNTLNVQHTLWESCISALDLDIQYFGGSLLTVYSMPAASNLHTVVFHFRGFSCDVIVGPLVNVHQHIVTSSTDCLKVEEYVYLGWERDTD